MRKGIALAVLALVVYMLVPAPASACGMDSQCYMWNPGYQNCVGTSNMVFHSCTINCDNQADAACNHIQNQDERAQCWASVYATCDNSCNSNHCSDLDNCWNNNYCYYW
jgi:hypothetical protein